MLFLSYFNPTFDLFEDVLEDETMVREHTIVSQMNAIMQDKIGRLPIEILDIQEMSRQRVDGHVSFIDVKVNEKYLCMNT